MVTLRRQSAQRGYSYLVLLAFIAVAGLVAASAGELWSSQERRLRERETRAVGEQYQRAIRSYFYATPGTVKRYPNKITDLLEDTRQVGTVRHLRKPYLDPLTDQPWCLIRDLDGGIKGVFSRGGRPAVTTIRRVPSRDFEFVATAAEHSADSQESLRDC